MLYILNAYVFYSIVLLSFKNKDIKTLFYSKKFI